MSRTIKELVVFVASPSDVAEERDQLEDVVTELNDSVFDRQNVRLSLVRWETHAYPGFGPDPQEVINEQIGSEYDIFLGILWSRIGTRTKKAESGTIEEFNSAYKKWKDCPSKIKIMIYFKNQAVDPYSLDIEQFKSVKAFKSGLPEKGGLHWSYSSTSDFVSLARKHLIKAVNELLVDANDGAKLTKNHIEEESETETQVDDEEGLLDLLDKWENCFDVIGGIIGSYTKSISDLGGDVNQAVEHLNAIGAVDDLPGRKSAKRIINSLATKLDLFANVLDSDTPVLDEAFAEAISALDKGIEIAPDFGQEGIDGIKQSRDDLLSFLDTMGYALGPIDGMQASVDSLPRVTSRFNHSRKKASQALGNLSQCLRSAMDQMDASLALIDDYE
ncbi:MAG: hypothetical protein KC996_06555 [Phycisphaerales bacterium]|nr:hypothetical protein [Phycisphaerales bacterium]